MGDAVKQFEESLACGRALSYRFLRDAKGWRVFVSIAASPVQPITDRRLGSIGIGIDINPDQLVLAELDRFGNFTGGEPVSNAVRETLWHKMPYFRNGAGEESVKLHSDRDRAVINLAGFLRSFGVGLMGVVLGIYLSRLGFSSLTIGLVIGIGLAGAASATVMVSFFADRFGRKPSLLVLSLFTAIGGLGLAFSPPLPCLLGMVFLGMLNGTGTERSASYALEQAVLPGLVADSRRTWSLAFYNVLIDGGGSLGALSAGLPLILHNRLDVPLLTAYKFVFLGFSALYVATAGLYSFLSPAIEILTSTAAPPATSRIAPETRRVVTHLTALFSLDAFGGGFLTDALVSYWFFHRFGIAERELGLVFFTVHVLNALSHLGAAWLARRIGLLNTMVFTHLPSSIVLMTVPFAPSFKWAAILFFCREALVEMDVPTRQSYVAALVKPAERTFTSGVTNLARNVCWAVGSATAGVAMQIFGFSTPLFIGGTAKIGYDLLLYKSFRRLKAPEETAR